jgi:hypothetical protein
MADLDPTSAVAPSPQAVESAAPPGGGPATENPQDDSAAVSDKVKTPRERLLGIADAENRVARRMAGLQDGFNRRGELLGVAMPQCYLKLVAGLRTAVRDFNAQLVDLPEYPLTRLNWYESPNVALGDTVTGDGMRVRVSRKNSYFDLMLRMVARSGKSDIPIIEGYGSIGRDIIRTETLLRIEGWIEKGQVVFWVSLDFKRRSMPLEEIPDRIVMAVASHDYGQLTRSFSQTEKPTDEAELPIVEPAVVEPEVPIVTSKSILSTHNR